MNVIATAKIIATSTNRLLPARAKATGRIGCPSDAFAPALGPKRLGRRPAGQGSGMSPSTDSVPRVALRDGRHIAQLGFGVFQVPPEDTAEAVGRALSIGYRHVDTAAAYENETGVGEAVKASGLERGDVFVTTKCFNDDHGYEEAGRALRASLDRLEMDFVDLYLIHWPVPSKDRYVETWKAFIDAQEEGLVRSIGVSNFQPAHLERLVEETGVTPAVNQVELHPRLQQAGLRRTHADLGVVTEAWSPLAQGEVLDDPTITEIAEAHERTPGQVVIRWHIQLGNVVIPKSVTPERIAENFRVFDFELSDEEMRAIERLDSGERIGPDPDEFEGPS
jgi:2,5-diketo-D-gluconate reductase A